MGEAMNARERMLSAMRRQPTDRVPTDIWATPEVWSQLGARFGSREEACEQLHIDGMAYVDASYIGPSPDAPEGEAANYWGVRTRPVYYEGGVYNEQCFNPLAAARTVDDVEAYAWPSTEWFDYSLMRERAVTLREMQVVQCGYMAPFYFHNNLRGLELSLMDPLDDPDLTHHIVKRICDFFFDHHRCMFETCEGLIDVAQVTDDLGAQTGPLISLELYRKFYAPHHKRFIDLCKAFGILVLHHDDGSIRPFLPDLVEMGIDVLNPVQWTCTDMDMVGLKRDFGDRICFHGAIDNQRILPFGTAEDVRSEVRTCIDALASDQRGYVLAPCHNIQANTPVGNIVAMYDEAHSYGAYH